MTRMTWLPPHSGWREQMLTMTADTAWPVAVALAGTRLDFVATNALDTALRRHRSAPPSGLGTVPVRLALLGGATMEHLAPAIRVGGMRRGMWIDTHVPDFGTWRQALADTGSSLHRFGPTAVVLCLDAQDLVAGLRADMTGEEADAHLAATLSRIRETWQAIRAAFNGPILHQAMLPTAHPVLGMQEHRLPGSPLRFATRLNAELRAAAEEAGVDILPLDDHATRDGVAAWHDPIRWWHARQEIAPQAAPMFGDLVARWLAAGQGRSFKCLVLDLDNTLWGGVIGDDGMEGIRLGQGSAEGEAFAAFQAYARELGRRGVILAVCSKNEHANAVEPFEAHPDMVLRRPDIACLVANWTDKPTNLRAIAETLNIGLDALVFADDNPVERDLVRRELPMVAVPELGDDPSRYAAILAEAGYFDAIRITDEDRERAGLYRDNQAREAWRASVTDMGSYLAGLEMRLVWRHFDRLGLGRIVQLINKSNQFNLTTRRYTEQAVLDVMDDPEAVGLQFRLLDRFGDNGIIAIVIGRLRPGAEGRDRALWIDTWLMSCRVLGRGVEAATLRVLHAMAHTLGAQHLVGEYIPSRKNMMVCDHYERLGFSVIRREPDGRSEAELRVDIHDHSTQSMEIVAG